jgi:sulfite reductase (ferredoxin)
MLDEAFSNGAVDKELLKKLITKYGDIGSESLPDDYYYDYGSDDPFSLAGRGPGECGAGVMDVIKLDIDEAKDALKKTPVENENIYKAIVTSARALLVTVGLEPKKDREIFAAFSEHLIMPGWVKSQTQQLLDEAIDWRMGDRELLDDLLPRVQELAGRVEELFLSLDANLKFKVEPIESKTPAEHADEKTHKTDLRGVACPLNFVKAKLELEKIEIGDVLEVLHDEGESVRGHFCVKVRRTK